MPTQPKSSSSRSQRGQPAPATPMPVTTAPGQRGTSIANFKPPPPEQMRRWFALARAYFNPEFLGLWELDLKKPALFVGNHTLFGLTDAPLMIEHLYSQYGLMLRGLGDRGHFNVPYWGESLVKNGMVLGTPENCSALMNAGQSILVFPGGGREVMRRKGEAYQLIWKKRTGFARMAIEHGYDIIPFGSVGPDESFDILVDANDIQKSRAWQWLDERFGLGEKTRNGDMIGPLVRGVGPTLLPRPQRFYFGFGQRISTAHLGGRSDDAEALWAVREQVARSVEQQIQRLQIYRKEDRLQNWSLLRRWLAPINRV